MDLDVHTTNGHHGSQPRLHQQGQEVQRFGTVRLFPIALSHDARVVSCSALNRILADTMILYSLYKKHHWIVRGNTFFPLHLLLDKHAGEQLAHEQIIEALRDGIARTDANGDAGTNDLLSDVLRRHEMQVWFLAEHLVDTPVAVAADGK